MKIDGFLNGYASTLDDEDDRVPTWWWNADSIIADAIRAAARHVRKDGSHSFKIGEERELERLESLAKAYSPDDGLPDDDYKHFMKLLAKWLPRLWD